MKWEHKLFWGWCLEGSTEEISPEVSFIVCVHEMLLFPGPCCIFECWLQVSLEPLREQLSGMQLGSWHSHFTGLHELRVLLFLGLFMVRNATMISQWPDINFKCLLVCSSSRKKTDSNSTFTKHLLVSSVLPTNLLVFVFIPDERKSCVDSIGKETFNCHVKLFNFL